MKKLLQSTIENDTGAYNVWIEKRFCHDEYRFYAKHISVKVNGEHYHIDSMLDSFRYAVMGPVSLTCDSDFTEYEIRLNEFGGGYVGKITELKRRLQGFCWDVNRMAKNKIRRIL